MPDQPPRPFGFWIWLEKFRRWMASGVAARRPTPPPSSPVESPESPACDQPAAYTLPPRPFGVWVDDVLSGKRSTPVPLSEMPDRSLDTHGDFIQGAAWFAVAVVAAWQGGMVLSASLYPATGDAAAVALVNMAAAMRAVALIVATAAIAQAIRSSAFVRGLALFVFILAVIVFVAARVTK